MRNRDKGNICQYTRSESDVLRRNCAAFMRRFDEPVPYEQALLEMVEWCEEVTREECGTGEFMALAQALGDLIRRGKLARIVDKDGVERFYFRRRRGARSFFAGSARR